MTFLDLTQFQNDDKSALEVAEGGEYNLRIKNMDCTNEGDMILHYKGAGGDEDLRPYIRPVLEIIDHVDADNLADIRTMITLPYPGMDGKDKKKCLNRLASFDECFGLGFFTQALTKEDFVGKVGTAIIEKVNKPVYGDQNDVKQFLVNR